MRHLEKNTQSVNIRLLDRFYRIFLVACIIFLTIGVPFVFYRKTASAIASIILTVAILLAWRMSRRGQPQKSLKLFAIGIWVIQIGLTFAGLPPYTAATALSMSVMLAVVVHLRAGVFYGASYLIAWLLYIVLQMLHLAPDPYFPGTLLTGWFIAGVAIWLVLLPIHELVLGLRRSASLQRAVTEAATDAILVVNNLGQVETYNQRFLDFWHIPSTFVQTHTDSNSELLDFVAQQLVDPAAFLQKVKELYAHPDQTSVDILRFKDGRVFERYSHPQRLDGRIVGRVWSFRDVTEKERSQTALIHGKDQLEAILNATSESIFLVDRNGVMLVINATAAHRLNRDSRQMIGQCVFDIFPPDVSATRRTALADVFQTGQAKYTEDERAERSFALNYFPVVGADGGVESVAVFAADITDRKRAEQAAEALLQRNQLLMQTATEGIHILDCSGNLVEANNAFADMLGYTLQELTHRHVSDWETICSKDQLLVRVGELIQQGGAFETVHRCKDGSLLDVEVHARGVCIEGQKFLYAASRDISQRKRNEAQLVEREARLASLMASMQDTVVVLDYQSRVLEYFLPQGTRSPAFSASENAIVGKTCGELLPAACARLFSDAIAALVTNDQPQTFEYSVTHAGQAYFFLVTMSHISGSSHDEGEFLTVVRDNTVRRNARLEIERLAQRNKLLLDSVGEGIFDVNLAGKTTFTNPAALTMLGLTEEQILGKDQHALFHHHREDGSPYLHEQCPIYQVLHDGRRRQLESEWFWRQDGTGFPVSLIVTPIVEAGQRLGAVVVFQDITERKSAEAEIHRLAFHDALTLLPNRRLLNDRLEQTMAACKRSGQHGAVLFLDLDNFKPLNDLHGHGVGDMLLVEVAKRITSCVREMDTVARFGGDEFVVLLGKLGADLDAAGLHCGRVAEKIRLALAQTYHLIVPQAIGEDMQVSHHCSCSIGIAMFPEQTVTADEVLKRADLAMYRAKEAGRNAVSFYKPDSP